MTDIAFQAWPKTPRLFKEPMIITEKIDGTNSAVGVVEYYYDEPVHPNTVLAKNTLDGGGGVYHLVYAQSRNRIITPQSVGGKGSDNYNFAEWVWGNADELAGLLGPGLHFGEWWGAGICRGYGQTGRHFSLFNTSRWGHLEIPEARAAIEPPAELTVVPVLNIHTLDTDQIRETLDALKFTGSHAAPGYDNPEGICVFLPGAKQTFKVTFDDEHKSRQARVLAEIGA